MLLELFGGRRKKGTTSLLLLLVWCLKLAGGPTLCMGVLGGLYRPTPRGYNGNPAGRGAQPSVTTLAGFCAGCWGPPAAGSLVDRQAPLSKALSVAGYCCLNLVTRASPRWAWLQCRRPAGDRCSLTACCLLNGASSSREVASRLWGVGSILGRLGEAWPPSGVSLPKGAHCLWATLAARHG